MYKNKFRVLYRLGRYVFIINEVGRLQCKKICTNINSMVIKITDKISVSVLLDLII